MTDIAAASPLPQIRSALSTLEQLAVAATAHEWRVDTWTNDHGREFLVLADHGVGAPAFAIQNEADAAFIAHNDPATVLRQCAADRNTLHRHRPQDEGCVLPRLGCAWCSSDDRPVRFPCPDIVDLAERHGVRP